MKWASYPACLFFECRHFTSGIQGNHEGADRYFDLEKTSRQNASSRW